MSAAPEIGRLAFASYLDVVGEEAERLSDVGSSGLAPSVPTCPDWTVADLIAHVADVYRHWSAQLEAAEPEEAAEVTDSPPSDDVLATLDHEAAHLLRALERAGPDSPCWNWSGSDLVSGWVARRMAHETAVHRFDGERAYGRGTPVETELAVDGVDERIEVHLVVDVVETPSASLGGSLCMVCTDADAAWVLDVADGRVRWRRGRGPADVVLVGTASELLLFSWNRVELDVLEVTGRREVAAAWRTLPS
ncbi:MAG: hypothetical protein JWO62_3056 [Acidimicrobiaceae bacterium]|nr:hypothetical protein [Acidimicrobiaceae bacterium]